MPLYSLDGVAPTIDAGAFVAPSAVLIGDVRVEAGASIWFNAVLRADFSRIVIRQGANVQDGSILHGTPDNATEICKDATVGHLCVVHGAVIGEESIVGNGTVVMDGATIGARSLVAAGSMVGIGADIPDAVMAAGAPAQVRREISGTPIEAMLDAQPGGYQDLARRYLGGLVKVE
jgi:carbonic anhydrase/acetyltransferase-like protein (isoleucine patch superfamily)